MSPLADINRIIFKTKFIMNNKRFVKINYNKIWYLLDKEDKTAEITPYEKVIVDLNNLKDNDRQYYEYLRDTEKEGILYIPTTYNQDPEEWISDLIIPETIPFEGENYTVTSIGDGAFSPTANYDASKGLYIENSTTLPDTITKIGDCAFFMNYKPCLNNMPKNLKRIGSFAFRNAENIGFGTNLPNSVETVGPYAYSGVCDTLCEFTIPASMTKIEENSFSDYDLMTKITIHKDVELIRTHAFGAHFSAVELNTVVSYIENPDKCELEDEAFGYAINDVKLYIPSGTKELYENNESWSTFGEIIEMEPEEAVSCCSQNNKKHFPWDIAIIAILAITDIILIILQ